MAFTPPRAWRVGDKATGALLNTYVRDNLLASEVPAVTTAGDILYGSGALAVARLALSGAADRALRVNAGATAPSWELRALRWWVDIDPLLGGVANTNWNTQTFVSGNLFGGFLNSSAAQNAEVSWPVVLAAGTWTCRVTYHRSTDGGIFSIQLDGSEVGTVDSYGVDAYNQIADVTGISVAASGKKTFKLKMATKNAASSAYRGGVQHVTWIRTA